MLEAKTPASAWKPSRGDAEERAADPVPAVEDDVGASMVKGRSSAVPRESFEIARTPNVPAVDGSRRAEGASPSDDRDDAWWGEDLVNAADSDEDDLVAGGRGRLSFPSESAVSGAHENTNDPKGSPRGRDLPPRKPFPRALAAARGQPPFSAARTARGRLAGDGSCRCFVCGGEHTRNAMVLFSRCFHPVCAACADAWAEKRGRFCPACKQKFEGWHFGEPDARGRWRRRFLRLDPEPDASSKGRGRCKPARFARALAFEPEDPPEASGGTAARNRRRGLESRIEKKRKKSPDDGPDPSSSSAAAAAAAADDDDEVGAVTRERGGESFQTPAPAGDAREYGT
jgi:hypothetical protein